jgi:hypothetical protein
LYGVAFPVPDTIEAVDMVRRVLALPELAPVWEGKRAVCELEILDAQGQARRIDRLARVDDSLWIIDYKWSVDARRRAEYMAQLAGYRLLVGQLEPGPFNAPGPVRTVLVDAAAVRPKPPHLSFAQAAGVSARSGPAIAEFMPKVETLLTISVWPSGRSRMTYSLAIQKAMVETRWGQASN